MANPYYNQSGTPATKAAGSSSPMRGEFALVAAGFAMLPAVLSGNAGAYVVVNAGGTALTTSTVLSVSGLTTRNDWLTASPPTPTLGWPVPASTAVFLAQDGKIALTVASRTSDLSASYGSNDTTIGVASFAINDNTARFLAAYSFYAEARIDTGVTGTAFCFEADAINLTGAAVGPSTPYHQLFNSSAVPLWMASGGGLTTNDSIAVYDVPACLAIVNNDAKFMTGISFGATAITGTDGVTGFGTAIALAKGHEIQWYAAGGSNGVQTASITSTIANAANAASLQFQDGALLLLGPQSQIEFAVSTVVNAVNGIGVTPALTGVAPTLTAFGSDTNVSLALTAKGTGAIVPFATIKPDTSIAAALSLLSGASPQGIYWSNSGGSQTSAILSKVTLGTNFTSIQFQDGGVLFMGPGTVFTASLSVATVNNATRGLGVTAGVSTTAPTLAAYGDTGNPNIGLKPNTGGQIETNAPTQSNAVAGTGGSVPATVAAFMQMTVNNTSYAIPLFPTH